MWLNSPWQVCILVTGICLSERPADLTFSAPARCYFRSYNRHEIITRALHEHYFQYQ
jgi:uncharacterized protein (UPF0297 family)